MSTFDFCTDVFCEIVIIQILLIYHHLTINIYEQSRNMYLFYYLNNTYVIILTKATQLLITATIKIVIQ